MKEHDVKLTDLVDLNEPNLRIISEISYLEGKEYEDFVTLVNSNIAKIHEQTEQFNIKWEEIQKEAKHKLTKDQDHQSDDSNAFWKYMKDSSEIYSGISQDFEYYNDLVEIERDINNKDERYKAKVAKIANEAPQIGFIILLNSAIRHGIPELVKSLLDSKEQIEQIDLDDALRFNAACGDFDGRCIRIANILLEKGANPAAENSVEVNAVTIAKNIWSIGICEYSYSGKRINTSQRHEPLGSGIFFAKGLLEEYGRAAMATLLHERHRAQEKETLEEKLDKVRKAKEDSKKEKPTFSPSLNALIQTARKGDDEGAKKQILEQKDVIEKKIESDKQEIEHLKEEEAILEEKKKENDASSLMIKKYANQFLSSLQKAKDSTTNSTKEKYDTDIKNAIDRANKDKDQLEKELQRVREEKARAEKEHREEVSFFRDFVSKKLDKQAKKLEKIDSTTTKTLNNTEEIKQIVQSLSASLTEYHLTQLQAQEKTTKDLKAAKKELTKAIAKATAEQTEEAKTVQQNAEKKHKSLKRQLTTIKSDIADVKQMQDEFGDNLEKMHDDIKSIFATLKELKGQIASSRNEKQEALKKLNETSGMELFKLAIERNLLLMLERNADIASGDKQKTDKAKGVMDLADDAWEKAKDVTDTFTKALSSNPYTAIAAASIGLIANIAFKIKDKHDQHAAKKKSDTIKMADLDNMFQEIAEDLSHKYRNIIEGGYLTRRGVIKTSEVAVGILFKHIGSKEFRSKIATEDAAVKLPKSDITNMLLDRIETPGVTAGHRSEKLAYSKKNKESDLTEKGDQLRQKHGKKRHLRASHYLSSEALIQNGYRVEVHRKHENNTIFVHPNQDTEKTLPLPIAYFEKAGSKDRIGGAEFKSAEYSATDVHEDTKKYLTGKTSLSQANPPTSRSLRIPEKKATSDPTAPKNWQQMLQQEKEGRKKAEQETKSLRKELDRLKTNSKSESNIRALMSQTTSVIPVKARSGIKLTNKTEGIEVRLQFKTKDGFDEAVRIFGPYRKNDGEREGQNNSKYYVYHAIVDSATAATLQQEKLEKK